MGSILRGIKPNDITWESRPASLQNCEWGRNGPLNSQSIRRPMYDKLRRYRPGSIRTITCGPLAKIGYGPHSFGNLRPLCNGARSATGWQEHVACQDSHLWKGSANTRPWKKALVTGIWYCTENMEAPNYNWAKLLMKASWVDGLQSPNWLEDLS